MRFYFPDSQDLVSPAYDFLRDEYPPHRVRQRDDLYAHEVLEKAPYHGILVSKAIVDGSVKGGGKYTGAQRARLQRMGVNRFFRLPSNVLTLGDNGAFNYVEEEIPPVTVAETLDFYVESGFDAGISTDHVIFGYDETAPLGDPAPVEWQERRALTLRLAEEFINSTQDQGVSLDPVGAAQGWSPQSYADSVRRLEDLGYRRIALGGMVPLKTAQIIDCLKAIDDDRRSRPDGWQPAELHLLGITRIDSMEEFAALGVTSFDSTSSFRQAFMDDRKNYHIENTSFVALRVPQVDGNPTLKRAILAGTVSQSEAIAAERAVLKALRAFTGAPNEVRGCLDVLGAYEQICGSKKSYLDAYERTLTAAPWLHCSCTLCRKHGIEIAIFRGTERNKRRGFHNLSVLADRMDSLSLPQRKSIDD
ncbi:tRNA-guanine transglycosylase DpdA [Nocardioides yefusunii]|uniref:tRNA-guanine transglycosylase DpdA n=1 Tax=Nocardioides yefusunii TaxID=2500546 RepID=A0ABW1R2P7_9ACTN|nr:tRNA-guanine transglycosylase DpdA [Nocardioides yefusunii]